MIALFSFSGAINCDEDIIHNAARCGSCSTGTEPTKWDSENGKCWGEQKKTQQLLYFICNGVVGPID